MYVLHTHVGMTVLFCTLEDNTVFVYANHTIDYQHIHLLMPCSTAYHFSLATANTLAK